MFRQVVIILILTVILTACGGAAPAFEAPVEELAAEEPAVQDLVAEPTTDLFPWAWEWQW